LLLENCKNKLIFFSHNKKGDHWPPFYDLLCCMG
jgi:hypothetical protein